MDRGLLRPAQVVRAFDGADVDLVRRLMTEGHLPVEHFEVNGHRYRGVPVEDVDRLVERIKVDKARKPSAL